MSQVALVCMPWASAHRGSIALGILKRALKRRGLPSDTHYLNVRLAARMHRGVYETLSNISLLGDWLFAQHLFGPGGSGELANRHEDVVRAGGRDLLAVLNRYPIDPEAIVQNILPPFLDSCLDDIPWGEYAVIGFTSVFVQHAACLLLSRRIKARWPGTRIVLGGSNVSGPMGRETIRAFDWVDYVVDGEGEEVFPELARRILEGRSGRDLPGVSCRENGNLHLASGMTPLTPVDRIPVPDYHDYFAALRQSGLTDRVSPRVLYEGARGCWWGQKSPCTFCSQNGQSLTFRAKPARRVLRELKLLSRRHECLNFEAVDNVLDPRQLRDLFPALVREGNDFKLFYDVRSTLTRRQVAVLRAAGVRALEVGIEGLHDGVLRLMHKGVSALQNIQMLKWCAEEDILVTWHLLFGLPGETPAHYTEILATVRKLTHLHPPVTAGRILLQRFSPYFQEPGRWGIRGVKPKRLYAFIYPPEKVQMDELAFHFDWSWEDRLAELDRLAAPLEVLAENWRSAYRHQQICFRYRRGPGFIELIDNRPLEPEWRLDAPRRWVLKDLAAAVFTACDEAMTFRKLVSTVSNGTGPRGPEDVRRVLTEMVEQSLILESAGRYLSLALPWDGSP